MGAFQQDNLRSGAIPTEEDIYSTLKVLLRIRDELVGQNNNLSFLQEEKVEKYLKYLISILETEVLTFFGTEVQNHRE